MYIYENDILGNGILRMHARVHRNWEYIVTPPRPPLARRSTSPDLGCRRIEAGLKSHPGWIPIASWQDGHDIAAGLWPQMWSDHDQECGRIMVAMSWSDSAKSRQDQSQILTGLQPDSDQITVRFWLDCGSIRRSDDAVRGQQRRLDGVQGLGFNAHPIGRRAVRGAAG